MDTPILSSNQEIQFPTQAKFAVQAIAATETLRLRNEILRPDLALKKCVYPGDSESSTHHFGCISAGQVVGIVSIYRRSNAVMKNSIGFQIRAMATCESVRGKGLGLKLLSIAENVAFNSGANYLWANARAAAVGFYTRAGYRVFGNKFHIEDIGPHFLVYRLNSEYTDQDKPACTPKKLILH